MLTDYLYKKLIINYNKNIKFSDYQATNFPEYSLITFRSEERRVGKECRSRWSPYH